MIMIMIMIIISIIIIISIRISIIDHHHLSSQCLLKKYPVVHLSLVDHEGHAPPVGLSCTATAKRFDLLDLRVFDLRGG
jgi:hypothetical protein